VILIISDDEYMSSRPIEESPILVGSITFLVTKLSRRLTQEIDRRLAPLKLNIKLVAVLAETLQRGPSTQKALGEAVEIDRTSMVLIIDNLERMNLVTRTVDPDDRRALRVTVTPAGRRALDKARDAIKAVECALLEHIPRPSRASLLRALQSLYSHDYCFAPSRYS
jgi:DNA-binding MarR family transcriptional regulator